MADPFHSVAGYARLEALLEAIPDPTLLLDLDKTVLAANDAFRAFFSMGKSVNGQRCHDVCHCHSGPCKAPGESCPFDECLAKAAPVQALHVHESADGGLLTALTMRPLTNPSGEIDSLLEVMQPIEFASATPSLKQNLHGESAAFRLMLQEIRRIAPTEKPVLIAGEPGTDREYVARAIHDLSRRRDRPFVPVDCAALRDWQFERELFGHEAAAFPGAGPATEGLVGAANGGTLYLKEIDALNLPAQAKLLRLLETGFYLPEGATRPRQARFRLIASGASDLISAVERGAFRNDLRLYIGCFPIRVPPLRDRPDDIPLLVECARMRLNCQPPCSEIDPQAMARLRAYRYPGNLRELRSIVERACLNADGGRIHPEHLPPEMRAEDSQPEIPGRLHFDGEVLPLSEAENLYVRWARQKLACSRVELAERLEISERTLYRRLSEAAETDS